MKKWGVNEVIDAFMFDMSQLGWFVTMDIQRVEERIKYLKRKAKMEGRILAPETKRGASKRRSSVQSKNRNRNKK